MQENTFIGTGHNPNGPDLPLGFGMQLAQEPKALETFAKLSNAEKSSMIGYIQACTTGEDSLNRIPTAVHQLKEGKTDLYS